jgi:hypothetical protein
MSRELHKDYTELDPESREFAQRILFHDLVETLIHNRERASGPQTLQNIMQNDVREYERLDNYEACCLYRDTYNSFCEDIWEIDGQQTYRTFNHYKNFDDI